MAYHFIQLKLGNKTFKDQVSTQGCSDVDDFIRAIKKKFSPALDAYAPYQLTLFQPDGTTEIDPGTLVADLKEIPCKPMVVTVEVPKQASPGRQRSYRGLSSVETCRRYLDALAQNLCFFYKFPWDPNSFLPTIGDVFKAVHQNTWKYQKRQKTLEERIREDGFIEPPSKVPRFDIPLAQLFDPSEWKILKELNRKTNEQIHSAAFLPQENAKFYIILPDFEFSDEAPHLVQKIGVKAKLFGSKEDLIVKKDGEKQFS